MRCSESHDVECSQTLLEEVEKSTPDISLVTRCVSGGADILYQPPDGDFPILHCCIWKGHARALEALLETQQDLDFTVEDRCELIPIHYLSWLNSREIKMQMTSAIVNRLMRHPNDRLDWGKRNKWGYDFLSYAAKEGVLSDLYPLVKQLDYFVAAPKPFLIHGKPEDDEAAERDWKRLPIDDRKLFERKW